MQSKLSMASSWTTDKGLVWRKQSAVKCKLNGSDDKDKANGTDDGCCCG